MAKNSPGSVPPKDTDINFLEERVGEGFEGIGAQDFTIPFLRVLQPQSPQCQEDRTEFIPGAKSGMFFNTVTERLYGKSIQLIPLMYKKLWLEWAPNRGGLVGRHDPNSISVDMSDFSKWKNQEGNIIAEHHVFYCLVANHLDEGPVAFSITSTGIKHAKNWNTQIMMTRLPSGGRAPFYGSVWELETVKCQNDQGVWYQIGEKKSMIKRIRFITLDEFKEYVDPVKQSLLTAQTDFAQLEDHTRDVTPSPTKSAF